MEKGSECSDSHTLLEDQVTQSVRIARIEGYFASFPSRTQTSPPTVTVASVKKFQRT